MATSICKPLRKRAFSDFHFSPPDRQPATKRKEDKKTDAVPSGKVLVVVAVTVGLVVVVVVVILRNVVDLDIDDDVESNEHGWILLLLSLKSLDDKCAQKFCMTQ